MSTEDEAGRTAANHEIFLWALYLLGGVDKKVDVEEIYLKAFELAPLRLGWRTRPDIPNFKKANHALGVVESRVGVDYLIKLGPNYRQFSPQGAAWIDENRERMEVLFSKESKQLISQNSDASRTAKKILSSQAWKLWSSNEEVPIAHIASALECSTFSTPDVWAGRIARIVAAGKSTENQEMLNFAQYVSELVLKDEDNND